MERLGLGILRGADVRELGQLLAAWRLSTVHRAGYLRDTAACAARAQTLQRMVCLMDQRSMCAFLAAIMTGWRSQCFRSLDQLLEIEQRAPSFVGVDSVSAEATRLATPVAPTDALGDQASQPSKVLDAQRVDAAGRAVALSTRGEVAAAMEHVLAIWRLVVVTSHQKAAHEDRTRLKLRELALHVGKKCGKLLEARRLDSLMLHCIIHWMLVVVRWSKHRQEEGEKDAEACVAHSGISNFCSSIFRPQVPGPAHPIILGRLRSRHLTVMYTNARTRATLHDALLRWQAAALQGGVTRGERRCTSQPPSVRSIGSCSPQGRNPWQQTPPCNRLGIQQCVSVPNSAGFLDVLTTQGSPCRALWGRSF